MLTWDHPVACSAVKLCYPSMAMPCAGTVQLISGSIKEADDT